VGLAEDPDVLDPDARAHLRRAASSFASLCDKLVDVDEKLHDRAASSRRAGNGRPTARR
jgi:hypothetical protein